MLARVQWDGYVYKYGGTFGAGFNFSAGEENDGYWKVYAPGTNVDGQENFIIIEETKGEVFILSDF